MQSERKVLDDDNYNRGRRRRKDTYDRLDSLWYKTNIFIYLTEIKLQRCWYHAAYFAINTIQIKNQLILMSKQLGSWRLAPTYLQQQKLRKKKGSSIWKKEKIQVKRTKLLKLHYKRRGTLHIFDISFLQRSKRHTHPQTLIHTRQ